MRIRRVLLIAPLVLLLLIAFVRPADAIIGGVPARPEFDFLVGFQWKVSGDPNSHVCSGSLVAPRWVLTAAHCKDDPDAGFQRALRANMPVTVGIGSGPWLTTERRKIVGTSDPLPNDMLLVLLDRPSGHTVVQLATPELNNLWARERRVTAVGRGQRSHYVTKSFDSNPGMDALMVELEIVNNGSDKGCGGLENICAKEPNDLSERERAIDLRGVLVNDATLGYINQSTMSAVIAEDRDAWKQKRLRAICHGDSGGPLLAISRGIPIQVGVTRAALDFGVSDCYAPLSFGKVGTTVQRPRILAAMETGPRTNGGRVVSLGGNVKVMISSEGTANLTSDIFLSARGSMQRIGTNRDAGKIVDLGIIPVGTELVFMIRNSGNEFFTGPSNRNRDGIVHNVSQVLTPNSVQVGFEDIYGGGDLDFDDVLFFVQGPVEVR